MNEPEQIWANKLRFYKETAPRSGVAVGDILAIPSGPAAVAREVDTWIGRLDVWRNPQPQTVGHEYHTARISVTVGRRFLAWFLGHHAPPNGGVMKFDRRVPAPTFCMEIETEKGDRFRFLGMALTEGQLTFEPATLVNFDMNFEILERRALDELTPATLTFSDPSIPGGICSAAWTFGAWGADPRIDDKLVAYAVNLYLTRPNLQVCQFNANGVPTRFTSSPWRILAEVRVPRGDLAAAAKSRAVGKLGVFIGPDGADLEFLTIATAYSTGDPVKAWDHREEVLSVECHPDAFASMLFVRDNYSEGI